jgi:hypothetical protein
LKEFDLAGFEVHLDELVAETIGGVATSRLAG